MEDKRISPDGTVRLRLRDNLTGQGLVLTALAMMALGVVMVFSACFDTSDSVRWYNRTDIRQAIFAAAALLVLVSLWRFDYHLLPRPIWPGWGKLAFLSTPAFFILVAGIGLSLLVLVPHVGQISHGQARWLKLGPVHIQPSEILKIGLIICIAAFLSRPNVDRRSFWRCFLPLMLAVGACAALVAKQNVSTAAIILLGATAVMIMGGVRWYYFAGMLPVVAAAGWFFITREPYRMARIMAFQNPFNSDLPASYQPLQSLLAIASGGLTPAGLGGGVAKYRYLPEIDNDFIFSSIAEEIGVVGTVLVVGMLLLWLLLSRRAALKAPDRLGMLLAGGIGMLVVLQGLLHIAVCAVAVPPTGVSLPFVSSGGSSLLTMSAAVAIMISITSRRSVAPGELRPAWHEEKARLGRA
jgi:cell division protein FtsW